MDADRQEQIKWLERRIFDLRNITQIHIQHGNVEDVEKIRTSISILEGQLQRAKQKRREEN